MRRAALQRLTILHQCLDGVGLYGTGEALVGALHTDMHGDSEEVAGEVGIDIDHAYCFFFGLLTRCMGRVSFLPKELGSAKKGTCAHLPTHNVAPLVAH